MPNWLCLAYVVEVEVQVGPGHPSMRLVCVWVCTCVGAYVVHEQVCMCVRACKHACVRMCMCVHIQKTALTDKEE